MWRTEPSDKPYPGSPTQDVTSWVHESRLRESKLRTGGSWFVCVNQMAGTDAPTHTQLQIMETTTKTPDISHG